MLYSSLGKALFFRQDSQWGFTYCDSHLEFLIYAIER